MKKKCNTKCYNGFTCANDYLDRELYEDDGYPTQEIDYVIKQCKQIVDQLEEIGNDN